MNLLLLTTSIALLCEGKLEIVEISVMDGFSLESPLAVFTLSRMRNNDTST